MVLGGWALPVPWMPRRLMPVLMGAAADMAYDSELAI